MASAAPYWEIVRTTAGFHARFRARNGRTIVSTEVYKKRDGALNAVLVLQAYGGSADVRDVDEVPDTPAPNLDDAEALGRWAAAQPKVRAEMKTGRKIHAIKELRGLSGAGLMQAKAALETLPRWKR